jgi:hypothetical protein
MGGGGKKFVCGDVREAAVVQHFDVADGDRIDAFVGLAEQVRADQ